jgi:hypothetical protein|tara:strand:+ start:683 stop:928 length:246 start_codon:yes stop_codon:yes gene_type:complete
MRFKEILEQATAGATSSGNVATVVSPHIAIGKDRTKKSFTGSPGKSGTKAPKPPKPKKQKPTDNALDMKGTSIFGGPLLKR